LTRIPPTIYLLPPDSHQERPMNVRPSLFALLALALIPNTSAAGPISFGYSTGNITTSPWAPELGLTLQPFQPPGPVWDFDPAGHTPVTLPAVYAEPTRLPTPAARDIHADGTTHWNNDGYFSVDVTVFDFTSDQFATVRFGGRAHMYNNYSTQAGWSGVTYFWFQNYAQVTLGGNDYTLWSDNLFTPGPATVNLWVGPNAPVSLAPEPTVLLLVSCGFAPIVLRRAWSRRRSLASC